MTNEERKRECNYWLKALNESHIIQRINREVLLSVSSLFRDRKSATALPVVEDRKHWIAILRTIRENAGHHLTARCPAGRWLDGWLQGDLSLSHVRRRQPTGMRRKRGKKRKRRKRTKRIRRNMKMMMRRKKRKK